MPMHPAQAAWLAAMMGCAPKYTHLPALQPDQLQAPLPVQHTDVGGVDVAWIDSGPPPGGATDVPVVLVHGLSSYMGFWEHQVPELSRSRRVLALDLPGYGASGRPDAPYTPPWYAEVVVSWMDAIGVEEAVLVGHSMGGQIAMTVALEHPDRVDRLVLAAPAGFETFGPGAKAWMKDWWTEDRATHATEAELRATFTTMVFNRQDAGTERLLEERVRMRGTEAFRGTSVAVSRSVAGMLDHPVAHRLGEIAVPTLVVYGTQDRMIPNPVFTGGRTAAIARAGAEAIPDAELVLVQGAGHTVHHDAPQAFNAAVTRFLDATARRPETP